MSRIVTAGAALAVAGLVTVARATTLPLAEVVAEVRTRNPEIEAARARATASAAVPARAAAWDDPVVSWEAWNAPESFAVERADNNIVRLSQKLPFPGKRRLAGRMAEREADGAAREADAVELEVVAAAKRAYWELWQRERTVEILERDRDLVERHTRIALDKYAVGEAAQPDVLRAQVELSHQANRVTMETIAAEGARAELNALMSRPPDAPLGSPEEPPAPRLAPSPETLVTRALETRPELHAEQAMVARAESGLRAAHLGYLPDVELSASRFVNARGRDGVGVMAALTIPLAFKGKYDAGVAEANARIVGAQADLRRVQDRVRREVQQAYLRARAALAEHDLFATTHIPHAEQALKASEIAYETGKVDFLSLIDSVRAVQSIHLEHVGASADFERAWADLERAVGAELPREGRP